MELYVDIDVTAPFCTISHFALNERTVTFELSTEDFERLDKIDKPSISFKGADWNTEYRRVNPTFVTGGSRFGMRQVTYAFVDAEEKPLGSWTLSVYERMTCVRKTSTGCINAYRAQAFSDSFINGPDGRSYKWSKMVLERTGENCSYERIPGENWQLVSKRTENRFSPEELDQTIDWVKSKLDRYSDQPEEETMPNEYYHTYGGWRQNYGTTHNHHQETLVKTTRKYARQAVIDRAKSRKDEFEKERETYNEAKLAHYKRELTKLEEDPEHTIDPNVRDEEGAMVKAFAKHALITNLQRFIEEMEIAAEEELTLDAEELGLLGL